MSKTPKSNSLLAAAGVAATATQTTPAPVQVLSLAELKAQQEAIAAQIAQATADAQAKALETIKAAMESSGLTIAQVTAHFPKVGKGSSAGQAVAPKYRNNATGETWSGRGLKPKWLAAAIASGASLGDFAIQTTH